MTIENLAEKLETFKDLQTAQSWRMDNFYISFENEYINVKRIDSSNMHGGQNVVNGKQWSIIFDIKKSFEQLSNWRLLNKYLGNDIKITPVTRGKFKNCYGIRLYKMAKDPTNEIIYDILNFIFEKQ